MVCPDVLGRGDSEWLDDPQGYVYTGYMSDMTALVAALGVQRLDWVGTSMGGLIGLCLAALPQTPLRSLVLNDVGPFYFLLLFEAHCTIYAPCTAICEFFSSL